MFIDLEKNWQDQVIIAFDTETTGKYPLQSEVCEIGAVKWKNGEIIDKFQSLIKPSVPMGEVVIKIHGITNEMVLDSPPISEVLPKFIDFIEGGLLIAHHAPFDLGFLATEMEKLSLQLPKNLSLCSSLLSRSLFPESKNHRLQTLIKFFNIEQGQAHRAFDDAVACLEVGLKCLEKFPKDNTPWSEIFDIQGTAQGEPLDWNRFSINSLDSNYKLIVEGAKKQKQVAIKYSSGSNPGKPRYVYPVGVVRSLNGDFFISEEPGSSIAKRFIFSRLIEVAETIEELEVSEN